MPRAASRTQQPNRRPARRRQEVRPLRFTQKLVLNQWMLHLFGATSFEQLAKDLKQEYLEGYDENNVSLFHHELTRDFFERGQITKQQLLGYDENIFKHTRRLLQRRSEPFRWKYFQYLALLFTEVYLDRFFTDSNRLLAELNAFLAEFNREKSDRDQVEPYTLSDLRKLAFWSATGSGKTLLMHVHIQQYRYYLEKHGRLRELNRIILLTPNEGLSRQHLEEFNRVGMPAELFNKDSASLFAGQTIEIIDIHKLGEEAGQKVVAVESFEGNNLVLVDEGHRGAGTETWKGFRDQLCEDGFSFEYSATFGQTVVAVNKKPLTDEYAKCIIFDFSYRYFYKDGYGKDYRILNLAEDRGDEARVKYLTACLLTFYQQLLLYEREKSEFAPFLIERPLWVFVGGSVTKDVSQKDISDVIDILLFLSDFLRDRKSYIKRIDALLKGTHGLLDTQKHRLFQNSFTAIVASKMEATNIYDDVLVKVFNASAAGALHVENLKGSAGEVALRVGDYDPFGVINVGDGAKLCKKAEEHPAKLVVKQVEFNESIFEALNDDDSKIHVLIGSKKFSEGWNSWRVSTMGLMNVGKSEGAQIIQLFGRGVRLKGYNHGLKRSTFVDGVKRPKYLREVETLNVFGIQAQYMEEFKKFLEEEGLPTGEDRIEFILPTFQTLGTQKLKVVQLPEGLDYKRDAPKPQLDKPTHRIPGRRVVLDWYPKIQARVAPGVRSSEDVAQLHQGSLTRKHLAFFDWDAVYRELLDFKNERTWYNLNISRDTLPELFAADSWYTLYIPHDQLQFSRFEQVRLWQEIAVTLTKKYADIFYKAKKAEWEAPKLVYAELQPDDPNFVSEYRFMSEQSEEQIRLQLNEIKEAVDKKLLKDFDFGKLHSISFSQHLYQPLIYLSSEYIQVTPVQLNEGEKQFVLDLRTYYEKNPSFFKKKELYLLRNRSRGRGIGFFEAGNFHPDFILWLVDSPKQYVSFIDPKGLRNLDGGMQNPKIQFYRTIKEIEKPHLDPNIVLNSFIVTPTRFSDPGWWNQGPTMEEFEKCHVFFQKEERERYVGMILKSLA